MTWDYIIVGGGSAGSVLANRLSARRSNRVLLLEAGRDTPHGKIPEVILDSYPGAAYLDERFLWTDLRVTTEVVSHNAPPEEMRPRLRRYEQARILGGGSSINGQMANRGAPTDYAQWEARGARGWGWDSVLPYFRKLERDMDFDDEYHGRSGPIPVRRIFPDLWCGHARAAGEAFAAAGYAYLPDQNGAFRDGYFPITSSNAYERRVSAAIGYLDPGTRSRENLRIDTDTHVTGLLFEGTRCVGVRARRGGEETEHRASEVILSCGAVHSPAQLLRAGIGPALALRDLGIEVRANVPGVGQRLMDHPSVALAGFLKPAARMDNVTTRRHVQVALRYSSGIGDAPAGDMFVVVASKSSWHAVGEQIGSYILFVNRTFSESGQVKLASPDWHAEPTVEFNLLSDHRDLARLVDGIRRLAQMYAHPAMRAAIEHPFPACWGEKVRQVGAINRKNALITAIAARLLDGPTALRDYIIERFIMDGWTLDQLVADDDAAQEFVRTAAVGVWHASCSCRMGDASDPMAVTDTEGRVRGVQGLRVVDASLFPVVPCANTNLPTMMVAEKIADTMLRGG
ncbi:MAG: GMC family oxidoreductase N-terminal domain-containing protein [Ectothiorhodospiraceae bacterium]|nr:GMC family oxidoreductase N-terminal domain-containing protein [Ectothiorhodospiraceae bacterium]